VRVPKADRPTGLAPGPPFSTLPAIRVLHRSHPTYLRCLAAVSTPPVPNHDHAHFAIANFDPVPAPAVKCARGSQSTPERESIATTCRARTRPIRTRRQTRACGAPARGAHVSMQHVVVSCVASVEGAAWSAGTSCALESRRYDARGERRIEKVSPSHWGAARRPPRSAWRGREGSRPGDWGQLSGLRLSPPRSSRCREEEVQEGFARIEVLPRRSC